MQYKQQFPVIGARVDNDNLPDPIAIGGEQHTIFDGYIKLHEVPYWNDGQPAVFITGYAETYDLDVAPFSFRVNYVTGRIFFHASQEGGSVSVSYRGLGSLTAVDEINWLWEQILSTRNFQGLYDTPETYTDSAHKMLGVNRSETGIEFVVPTVGRAVAAMNLFSLDAGETKVLEGSEYDLVGLYKIINGGEAGLAITVDENWERTGNVVQSTQGTGEEAITFWTVNDLEIGVTKCIDIGSLSIWNRVDSVVSTADTTAGGDIRIVPVLNGIPCAWVGGVFKPCSVETPSDVMANGIAPETLGTLPSVAFNSWVGETLGFIVGIQRVDPDDNPRWSGGISIQGWSGRGREQLTDFTVGLDTQAKQWFITNTRAETVHVAAVLGSGRDDVLCSADIFVFENVPAGASVQLKAPKQTTLQLFESTSQGTEGGVTATATNHWVKVVGDAAGLISPKPELGVRQGTFSEDALPLLTSVESFTSFKDGVVSNEGGTYDVRVDGAYDWAPGLTGAGLVLSGNNSLRVADSYRYKPIRADYVSYPAWALGGMFKWASGSPYIIMPNMTMYYDSRMGWYELCCAYLTQSSVVFRCGTTTSTIAYPAGSWVNVAMFSFRCYNEWIGEFSAYKAYYGYVNGATRYLRHNHSISGISEEYIPLPGSLGNGSHQINSNGTFILDHGYKLNSTSNAALFNSVRDVSGLVNSALHASEQYSVHELVTPFVISDWPQLSRMLVAESNAGMDNQNKYFVYSNNTSYVYDAVAGQFFAYSQAQPFDTLFEAGMTGAQVNAIPREAFLQIISDNMNIRQLSKMSALTDFTPTDGMNGLPNHLLAGAAILADERLRMWELKQPGADYTVQWIESSNTWLITNNTTSAKTLRVAAAGVSVPLRVGVTNFTELSDTPDSLDDQTPCTLVSVNGKVTKMPYVHHLMIGAI